MPTVHTTTIELELIDTDNKVYGIKELRAMLGTGLKEAKELWERMDNDGSVLWLEPTFTHVCTDSTLGRIVRAYFEGTRLADERKVQYPFNLQILKVSSVETDQ